MDAPGCPAVEMAGEPGLYVAANAEETICTKLSPGQSITFTVDSFPGHFFTGWVLWFGDPTAAVLPLLPHQNTGGGFTGVVQRVPVKIGIDDYRGLTLVPGRGTEVKIHIR